VMTHHEGFEFNAHRSGFNSHPKELAQPVVEYSPQSAPDRLTCLNSNPGLHRFARNNSISSCAVYNSAVQSLRSGIINQYHGSLV
jgi:hypothetical protein